MSKKKSLGQFNTTHKDYILSGFEAYVFGKIWVDPFAGDGDLLRWAVGHGASSVQGYDVDPDKKLPGRDSLRHPANYSGSWVITNPPYLARNKAPGDKSLYIDHGQNDLYKIAIKTVCEQAAEGGILIVPLNFLSSVEAGSIRDLFFHSYRIVKCKVFERPVFDDTSYTVCAFCFERGSQGDLEVEFIGFDGSKTLTYLVSKDYHWVLGQGFYKYLEGAEANGVGRWTVADVTDEVYKNVILARAIDTGTRGGMLGLTDIRQEMDPPLYLGLATARNLAHIRFDEPPSTDSQLKIISHVNATLVKFREEYNSVFLTAYRNSTRCGSRKRIGFDVIYKLISKARYAI